jgi:hypothetical protein
MEAAGRINSGFREQALESNAQICLRASEKIAMKIMSSDQLKDVLRSVADKLDRRDPLTTLSAGLMAAGPALAAANVVVIAAGAGGPAGAIFGAASLALGTTGMLFSAVVSQPKRRDSSLEHDDDTRLAEIIPPGNTRGHMASAFTRYREIKLPHEPKLG